MAAINPRINIVLEQELFNEVKLLAKRSGISLSLKVRDLVAEALNLNEDKIWLKKAKERRDTFNNSKALTHNQMWDKT
ncbi:MAG: antitoxin, RHH family protein [Deltaproteobacteria bacterium]|nr:antitoxin, RHH family protein [Deltaproteobacteria bacterium]